MASSMEVDPNQRTVPNTNSCCFLCLKHVVSVPTSQEDVSDIKIGDNVIPSETISLRSICRYLGVNFKYLLLSSFSTEDADGLLEMLQLSDFSVSLCKQCSNVIVPLSSLCTQLELLQMKVDYFLKTVTGILDDTGEEEDAFQDPPNVTACSGEEKNLQVFLKLLRMNMKRKCNVRLDQVVVPKVTLEKASSVLLGDGRILNSSSEMSFSTKKASTKITPASSRTSAVNGRNSKVKVKRKTCKKKSHSKRKSTQRSKPAKTSSSSTSSKENRRALKCNLCNKEFLHKTSLWRHKNLAHETTDASFEYAPCNHCDPPQMVRHRLRKEHNIRRHLDVHFRSAKLAHVPMNVFRDLCSHVVKKQVLECEKLDSTLKNNCIKNVKCKCAMCSIFITNVYKMHNHICSVHEANIRKKLVEIQENTSPQELISIEETFSRSRKKSKNACNVCGKVFKYFGCLSRHKAQHLKGTSRPKYKKLVHKKSMMKGDVTDDKSFDGERRAVKVEPFMGEIIIECESVPEAAVDSMSVQSQADKCSVVTPKVETGFDESMAAGANVYPADGNGIQEKENDDDQLFVEEEYVISYQFDNHGNDFEQDIKIHPD